MYRIDFWALAPGGAWGLDAYIVKNATDVLEVVEWANNQCNGRPFEIFVETDEDTPVVEEEQRNQGLIRVLGEAPDEGVAVQFGLMIKDSDSGN